MEHAYCLSYRFLNNVVLTTVIEMVEMVEILDERLGKRSVEQKSKSSYIQDVVDLKMYFSLVLTINCIHIKNGVYSIHSTNRSKTTPQGIQ